MLRDLAPILGRRLSVGVVPEWHGRWPLAAHPDYCRLVLEGAEELLLHGYFHQRQRGRGPTSLLTDRSDEMNGLDPEETRRTIENDERDRKSLNRCSPPVRMSKSTSRVPLGAWMASYKDRSNALRAGVIQ
jgi:predicted deacetylase